VRAIAPRGRNQSDGGILELPAATLSSRPLDGANTTCLYGPSHSIMVRTAAVQQRDPVGVMGTPRRLNQRGACAPELNLMLSRQFEIVACTFFRTNQPITGSKRG